MSRASTFTVLATAVALTGAAQAQTTGARPGFLDDLFGGGSQRPAQSGQMAQASDSDVVMRLDRLENEIRQLTGSIQQLQFRNQQLEQEVRALQGGGNYRPQDAGASGGGHAAIHQQSYPAQTYPQPSYPAQSYPQPSYPPAQVTPVEATPGSGRPDAFDPRLHPGAPGAPRPLGTIVEGPGTQSIAAPPVGAPGGRDSGAPLDLSTVSQPAGGAAMPAEPMSSDGALPPPPPRNTSATGAMASLTQPPTHSAKDEYDLAFGYMLHKDYAHAENAFKAFLQHHPSDRLAADATYWLGESLFQRQRYRDAAESFLSVTTKHDKSAKAPDALFRLGESLAALGEKEAACAALGEVGHKYPRASASVKQGVSREQKRVHC